MLFKEKYFVKFKHGITSSIDRFSLNSATSILVIWDAVRSHFYDMDMGNLVNLIEKQLPAADLLATLPFQTSPDTQSCFGNTCFRLLAANFYQYFLTRLPVLFRCNRLIHKGRKRIPSKKERNDIIHLCLTEYSGKYRDLNFPLSPDEHLRFARLARWYVRSRTRDDEVYSVQWLWDTLEATFPDLLKGNNISSITSHVIESCFPMYWDSFQESYRNSMLFYANMGWFVGDSDIDDIEAALLQSEKPKERIQ